MLENYMSHCDPHQKNIVSRDGNGCYHRADNVDECSVRQYYIDGEVISDNQIVKCDKLVLNDDRRTAYYIELKGSDIIKAISQVENTRALLKKDLLQYTSYYRIIYKTGTHDVNSSATIKWKERCGRDSKTGKAIAIVRNRKYEENI